MNGKMDSFPLVRGGREIDSIDGFTIPIRPQTRDDPFLWPKPPRFGKDQEMFRATKNFTTKERKKACNDYCYSDQ